MGDIVEGLTPPEPAQEPTVLERATVPSWIFPALAVVGGAAAFGLGWLNPIVIAALIVVAAIPLLMRAVRHYTRWESAVCSISADRCPLGGAIVVDYERGSRRPVDVGRGQLVAEIVCEEKIEYTTTDSDGDRVRRSSREEVGGDRFSSPVHPNTRGFVGQVTVIVPTDVGAPSMELDNHEINWELSIWVEGGDLPRGRKRYDIDVLPMLVLDDRVDEVYE